VSESLVCPGQLSVVTGDGSLSGQFECTDETGTPVPFVSSAAPAPYDPAANIETLMAHWSAGASLVLVMWLFAYPVRHIVRLFQSA
jgi:hypothetical protein